jgi:hypothetical protein
MKTFVVLTVSIILAGILLCPLAIAAPPSMPNDVQIVQPDPSLPKELAAFAGKWEGSGFHCGPTFPIQLFLIVEKITEEKVNLYVWYSLWGWNRREANVTQESGGYKLWFIGPTGRNEIILRKEELVLNAQPFWFTIGLKRVP